MMGLTIHVKGGVRIYGTPGVFNNFSSKADMAQKEWANKKYKAFILYGLWRSVITSPSISF